MSHYNTVTVTQSHDHMTQWKTIEGSKRNDIIQYIIHRLTLRKTYGYLE